MKPITFPEANVTFAKDQPQYLPLPAATLPDGHVVSCWQPNLWERIKVLCGANIFLSLLTFNQPLQPQKLYIGSPFVPTEDATPNSRSACETSGMKQAA